MIVMEYEGERHWVRETPVAAYLRRATDDDRFFTYYNARAGSWVIAYWVAPRRLFVELAVANAPAAFTPADVNWVIRWAKHRTPDGRSLRERVKSAERAYWREHDDQLREDLDYKQYLGRRAGVHLEDHPWFKIPGLAAVA